jgi:hypothetical protein
MSTQTQDIPTDVKENLLELASRLPSAAQSQFIRNTTEKLRDLSLQYQNTLVYTAVGWVVGEIIDNVLTIPFTEWSLTGDRSSDLGALIGGLAGFFSDQKRAKKLAEEQKRVAKIISDELKNAISSVEK